MQMLLDDMQSTRAVNVLATLWRLESAGKLLRTGDTIVAGPAFSIRLDDFAFRQRISGLGHDVLDGFAEKMLELLRPRGRWSAFTASQLKNLWQSEEVSTEDGLALFERLGLIIFRADGYHCTTGFVRFLDVLRE